MKFLKREIGEWAAIGLMAAVVLASVHYVDVRYRSWLLVLTVAFCLLKTAYYVLETLWQLHQAALKDSPYHRFVLLIAYNMVEVTFSFAVDYYCLEAVDRSSLSGVDESLHGGLLLFECFYFSVLNFSYFGYGEILPTNVAAKAIVITEIVTAFSTVIFLLSDFISMKESLRAMRKEPKE